ncbi:hypothetical protein SLS57_011215 [Botryosphaeria dothidea]
MRLLNCSTLQLEFFAGSVIPPYAILSHRWQDGEVLFEDMVIGRASQKLSYEKIEATCRQASRDGYAYVWVDTCCIDKSSSAELSEAINSMYAWYSYAAVCYAYLFDVSDEADTERNHANFSRSEWFRRGWTLQELVAPSHMVFFSQNWTRLGEKSTLTAVLAGATGIDPDVLAGATHLRSVSVAKRMSWAANRETTRLEDRAYCLMGLFDVNMPMLYGEGEKAFIRLQEEIMRSTDDETLFAWADEDAAASPGSPYGMLAKSPACFKYSGNFDPFPTTLRPEFAMTNKGLRISLRLKKHEEDGYIAALNCIRQPRGFAGIYLKKLNQTKNPSIAGDSQEYVRIRAHEVVMLSGPQGDDRAIYVRQNVQQQDAEKTYARGLLHLRQIPRIEEGYEIVTMLGDNVYDRQFIVYPNGARLAAVLVLERKTTRAYYKEHLEHRPGDGTKFALLFGSGGTLPFAFDACEWTDSGSRTADCLSQLAASFKPKPPGHYILLGPDRITVYFQPFLNKTQTAYGPRYEVFIQVSLDPAKCPPPPTKGLARILLRCYGAA